METALLKVHNDITLNMDNGKLTGLTLLASSAAFVSINNTILMDRMSLLYGVAGVALSWLKYYLSGRHQRVKTGDWFRHHLIFRVVYLRVQFWDRYLLHCAQIH